MSYRIAIGSSDGEVIDQHFGSSEQFVIYEVSNEGSWRLVDIRRNLHAGVMGHQELRLQQTAELVGDCTVVLVSQIGPGAGHLLKERGITAQTSEGYIEDALTRLVRFKRRFASKQQEAEG